MREKKLSFYEVDPRYFKDYSGDGTGDLNGLANKFDYFSYLGVDAIILKNVIAVDSIKDVETSYTQIAPEVGDINALIRIISKAKSAKQNVLIDLNIGSIKENHNWFKSAKTQDIEGYTDIVDFKANKEDSDANYGYSSESKKYFVKDAKTEEVPLNWKSDQVINHFFEVIRFWKKIGVNGFVFKNFEFLSDELKKESMSENTLKELRKFYRGIKEIDDKLILIGRSKSIPIKNIKNYTAGSTKVFDYFLSEIIAENGTSPKYGHDIIGKFRPKQLAKDIQVLANDHKNVLTFDTENIGRSISRWGNDSQYLKESAKAFAILLHLTTASSSIYYGSEIGTPNIGMTHLDNFQDKDIKERLSFIMSKKFSEKEFMDAQVLQGSINARALMAWDDEKNGGFSIAEKTITPPSTTFTEINVKNQYGDVSSVLSFTKLLVELINKPTYANIIRGGNINISSKVPGVIKYSIKDSKKERELLVFANLSSGNKPILRKLKDGKVILSSYDQKKYDGHPKSLEPYEAIIISKQTDEHFKATQAIKVAQLKDVEKKEKEEERLQKIKRKEEEAEAKEKARLDHEKEEAVRKAKLEKEKAEEIKRIAKEKQLADLEKLKAQEAAKKESMKFKQEKQKAKEAAAKEAKEFEDKIQKEKQEAAKVIQQQKDEEAAARLAEKEKRQQEKTRLIELRKQEKARENAAKEARMLEKTREMELKREQKEAERKEKQERKEAEIAAKQVESEMKSSKFEDKDISYSESNEIIHDINKTDENDFNDPHVGSIENSHVEIAKDQMQKNDKQEPWRKKEDKKENINPEIANAKASAIKDRSIDNSYKDHKTKLREEELAKTTLIDDDFDIDELFNEEKK